MQKRTIEEKQKIVNAIDRAREDTSLSVKEICKSHGISDGSYYTWRKQFNGNTSPDGNNTVYKSYTKEIEKKVVSLKKKHPYYGQNKIIKQLERFDGIKVKRNQVREILTKHNLLETSSSPRRKKGKRRFERLDPGELVQMDLMYYTLRKNRRFYLITVLDDYSRFVMAHKICSRQTADNVIDTLEMAVEKYGTPQEVLSDRGSQFHSWKGMSRFAKILDKMGMKHILASPQSPQTIGKVESWHRNIQRELFRQQEFNSVSDVRAAVADYVEYYNYKRVHMGIDYVTPADRFFKVSAGVKKQMKEPVSAYLTARIDGQPVRAEEKSKGKMAVTLAGKEIKEVEVNDLKKLLL